LRDKHNYVIHAEANAILNYRGSLRDLAGATVYVTLFPCQECAKTLAQAGIGEVVYLDDKYDGTEGNLISKSVLERCGVRTRQLRLPHPLD
jgi:dCMP deaminase